MRIKCEKCGTVFGLDENRVKEKGSRVRCAMCKNEFMVYRPTPAPAPVPAEPEEKEASAAFHDDDDDYDYGPEETVALPAGEIAFPEADSIDERAETYLLTGSIADTKPFIPSPEYSPKKHKKKFKPFRTKLLEFAAKIVVVIAVFVLFGEAFRVMQRLDQLIENAKNLVGGVNAAFDPSELSRINLFALKVLYLDTKRAEAGAKNSKALKKEREHLEKLLKSHGALAGTEKIFELIKNSKGDEHKDEKFYRAHAFNMLLMEGGILPEKTIAAKIDPSYREEFAEGYKYSRLLETAKFWESMFQADPGIIKILRKYKNIVMNAKEKSKEAGFSISEIYLMLDTGKKSGFFENKIAYLLDSIPWSENATSFCEPYEITDNEFWRELALKGKNGYGHNPLRDPVLPRFDTDEYGTWFGVWYTGKTDGVFNTFSIDFDAASVKELLLNICLIIVGVLALLAILVVFITKRLSDLVTRPITELTRGADQVSQGNYDYVVPIYKEDEFGDLTRQFNRMTKGQRERLNLMETLEKLLSKDLAEKAAKSGLVIGGQRADCTVMFTDFAGFSTITQKMRAGEAVNILNYYFSGLIPILKKYGGFPDKYIGDAIVGLFGAPVRLDDHAIRAVACAIEMQWKMREMNETRRKAGKTVFEMRIGLNSGDVLVGAIGCDLKLEFTSIGETTNLANRMESICEIGHVMIAEGTYKKIQNVFFKDVDIERTPRKVQVKGYPEPVSCYCIHVDRLKIEKDLLSDGPVKSFYIYTDGGYGIKRSPDDISDFAFDMVAQYIED